MPEYRLLQDALEQCALADALGFDYVWEVEHHFLEEYSHSSAPEVFLAAVSQRTKRPAARATASCRRRPASTIRRGSRSASRRSTSSRTAASTSARRVVLRGGAGRLPHRPRRQAGDVGGGPPRRAPLPQRVAVHGPPRALGDDAAAERRPEAAQKPHPPVWVACSRRETIHLAAQKGIGALTFAFVDPEDARHWVSDYQETLAREGVPIGDAVNANVACVSPFLCHPDEGEAMRRGLEGTNFFGYSLAHYYVFGRHHPARTDVWAEYQRQRGERGYDPEAVRAAAANQNRLGAKVVEGGIAGLRGAVGTPAQVREYLRRYEEAGVDQVIFVSQSGKTRHEDIMESLELFGREVLPEFKDRDAAAARAKAERLAPVIDRVMARKPAADHPPLPTKTTRSRRSRAAPRTAPGRTTSTASSTASPATPRRATRRCSTTGARGRATSEGRPDGRDRRTRDVHPHLLPLGHHPLHRRAVLRGADAAAIPFRPFWVMISGVVELLGAVLILSNRMAHIGGWLIFIFLVPVTIVVHGVRW
jgi:alkanesulfonate monooxygenase SsuD/methylene tetrahydromethanopterin reductase-like flavin-dependent oxidoreductase (luciferase family)